MHRYALLSVLALVAVGGHGCTSRSFTVTGKVTYNGAVLDKPGGQIVFVGPDGKQVPAAIAADGGYRAAKVSRGLNQVVVYYPNPNAQTGKVLPKPGYMPVASKQPEPPFLTPAKYVSAESSGLSTSVEKDSVFDVDLTGPPIP